MATPAEIQQLFITYFGRPADPSGLSFWTTSPDASNASLLTIANGFATTTEYQNSVAGLTLDQIVNNFYVRLFGRAGEPAGIRFWVDQIQNGNTSAQAVGVAIGAAATGTDLIARDSKIASSALWTTEIGLSTPALLAYSGNVGIAAGVQYLEPVVSVATIPTPSQTAASTATLVANSSIGQTFTLTTGIDVSGVMVGSAGTTSTDGNDTFITNNATWNAGDSINGGAGVDTLIFANESEDLTLAGRTLTSIENLTIINADPDTGGQEFNFANQMLQEVTIDFANTEHLNDVYLNNLRADTDLVVTNVIADGNNIFRNYDELYSALVGSVSQSNTFSNIDLSVLDNYLFFENYAYFNAATELNLTQTWTDVTNGGDSSSGADQYHAHSHNYVDLKADNAVVNITYNLTNILATESHSDIELYVDSGETAAVADTVNVTFNIDNVDGLTIEIVLDYNLSSTSAVSSDSDVLNINVGAGGLLNSDGNNEIVAEAFETINLTIDGDAEFVDIDTYVNIAAAQTINIVANANFVADVWDMADDQEVTINISGAGDVTFDMNGDNEGVTVNAATATGDLDLGVGSDPTFATVVTAGSGDDTITLLNAFELNDDDDAFLQVLDGGDGMNIFEIDADDLVTSQALLNADVTDFSDAIINFERLSLTSFAGQDLDLTTLGFNHVTIGDYTTGGSLTVEDAATVVVTGDGTTDVEIFVDGAATGDQSLNLTVNGADGIELNDLTVVDVETISIVSSASDPDDDTPDANTVDLIAAEATTLNLSGATELVFGVNSDFTNLETVDAAGFNADLTIDVSTADQGVTITVGDGDNDITGSDFDDTFVVGSGESVITGGLGADTITLGSGVNTLIYMDADESSGLNIDTITGFVAGSMGTSASPDFNVFDFSGVVSGESLSDVDFVGNFNSITAANTALSDTSGDLQIVFVSADNSIYVDVNDDGVINVGDMVIELTGMTGMLVASNFLG